MYGADEGWKLLHALLGSITLEALDPMGQEGAPTPKKTVVRGLAMPPRTAALLQDPMGPGGLAMPPATRSSAAGSDAARPSLAQPGGVGLAMPSPPTAALLQAAMLPAPLGSAGGKTILSPIDF